MNSQIAVTVAVIQHSNGTFLLTQRFSPHLPEVHLRWQLAGGKMNFGEQPQETLRRECLEELGVEIEVLSNLPSVHTKVWHHTGKEPRHTLVMGYLCKLKDENVQIKLNQESHSYQWFSYEEVLKLDPLPFTIEMIEEHTATMA